MTTFVTKYEKLLITKAAKIEMPTTTQSQMEANRTIPILILILSKFHEKGFEKNSPNEEG